MATRFNVTDFHYGEDVVIEFFAKNRDGTVLTSPGSATLTFTISATEAGSPTLEFAASPQITLQDSTTAEFQVNLALADYSSLTEGTSYFHNVWVDDASGNRMLQGRGVLKLKSSIEPS